MQKTLVHRPMEKALTKHKDEMSKKRFSKLNFYLNQIGQAIGASRVSLYK